MKSWFRWNKDEIRRIAALLLFLTGVILNLVNFILEKGWETHTSLLYPCFLAFELLVILVLLVREIFLLCRDRRKRAFEKADSEKQEPQGERDR